ncbi:SDR family NAD(P)-dependent oxidoreductase [Paucibacter soli]|uniref:SDR family NAD(P)-dependent oxidoreductase n=1 Tax=Paucibacter soli TaxID=3133433 RepID=UPI00309DABC4
MFQRQVVVITGGSSGLGPALARRFVAAGAKLALLARDAQKLAKVRAELLACAPPGASVETFVCDVGDEAACRVTMQAIAASLGAPDVLINSAGIVAEGYFQHSDMATQRRIFETNYFGAVNITLAAMPFFSARGSGRIVNIASLAGRLPTFGLTAYGPSKFALVGFSEGLRLELKPRGVRVQLACPGEFLTPMATALEATRSAENRQMNQAVPVMSLDAVADGVFAGIAADRFMIVPGRIARALDALHRLAPGLLRWLLDLRLRQVYVGPRQP